MKISLGNSRASWSRKEDFVRRIRVEQCYQRIKIEDCRKLRRMTLDELQEYYKELREAK